ncbi:unnamed protein product [Vitrella brassicaformis CCMP3155]|uniref:OBG-type G domain-containing protein n=1 Tax=Vitrella brassicaformis (strain CCMP3155) TaxID=1169540 RepID=A0A0G4EJV6_VITBC|nr:unnamed protein product [Vitrella brassicaformis CCMP3155]|eukprot:CEL97715.1 unnamed protein product [Vitrella brassicaformis CCMP3155]
MGQDFIIGCVGKPSAGKSTFFNAVTDGKAKIGNYPFTTIEPNQGVGYYTTQCPCKKYGVRCRPRYGWCHDGRRKVPVKLLDVAGLIPGASEGLGLGNKFLDDLRHADVLLHIIDVSGTTNEKGESTTGYDPSGDHEWLEMEVQLWIYNNLFSRWQTVAKRHQATNSPVVQTLLAQLSGYGAKEPLIQSVLDELHVKDPVNLMEWDKEQIRQLVTGWVRVFVRRRFMFILVLNKADSGGDTDANALKLSQKYDEGRIVMCSALAECFLRKMKDQKYIRYDEGSFMFTTAEEEENESEAQQPNGGQSSDDAPGSSKRPSSSQKPLKPLDGKVSQRLEKIRDMVLFRHGSTGVHQAIDRAVEVAGLVPVYPVKNITHFGGGGKGEGAFPECVLVRPGTTVRQFAGMLHHEIDKHFLYAEGPDGRRLGEDDEITAERNIIRYVTERAAEENSH